MSRHIFFLTFYLTFESYPALDIVCIAAGLYIAGVSKFFITGGTS
jgi:hypothetical protein